MNRRSFLLALGATACGAKAPPVRPRPSQRHETPESTYVCQGPFPDRQYAQLQRTPFALRGDRLARHRDERLVFYDANTFAPLGTVEVNSYTFCFLANGSLAAYVQPLGAKQCEVHVVDDQHNVRVYVGPEFAEVPDGEMVPGGSSDELFISDDDGVIARFELHANGEARETGRVKPDLTTWKRLRQLVSLGDGRVVTRGSRALLVQEPGKRDIKYTTPDEAAWHVAHAGGARVWYSYSIRDQPNVVDGIALATLGESLVVHERIGFAPETVAHLASAGGALAVLAAKVGSAAVIVYDASGQQRWRTEVPAEFYAPDQFADGAWIAMSEHRVILYGPKRALMSWDAATGAAGPTM